MANKLQEETTLVIVKPDGVKRGLVGEIIRRIERRGVRNIVHASGNIAEAEHELKLWFTPEELHAYSRAEEDIMF